MVFGLICVLIIFTFSVSGNPSIPLSQCGEIPREVHGCLGNFIIFTAAMIRNCIRSSNNQCDLMTCAFNNARWLRNGKVVKDKVRAHLELYRKENPQWSDAVGNATQACLTTDIPAQGVYLDCPAYDVTQCCFITFAQYASPDQWSTEERCQYPKQYVASCPMCPPECFSAQVPFGSCNSCLGLPRHLNET